MRFRAILNLVLLGSICWGCGASDTAGDTSLPPTTTRIVEEGDRVWLDDSTLYVLNRNKGLQVVALNDPAAPRVVGRAALSGEPGELYLHNGYIFALTINAAATSGGVGSRLGVVDVRSPEAPTRIQELSFPGKVTNSRLVGDVLYVVSDTGQTVYSVDLAMPSAARVVDQIALASPYCGGQVLATEQVIYVAAESWGSGMGGECGSAYTTNDGCTTITAIDITSPTGVLRRGTSYSLAGMLQDRWGIDHRDGVLRVLVSRGRWWSSKNTVSATMRTFQARTADEMEPIGWLNVDMGVSEDVMAVRFDGPVAYLVTFRNTDPLFTIDLTDPTQPRLGGTLQTPGWLDFIIPRGDRLLGIGRDLDAARGAWRLQASLYDVSVLAQPKLLARQLFGGSYTNLPDQADNFAKVVRVVDELGVLLVPYTQNSVGYDPSTVGGRLAILSFTRTDLTIMGEVQSADPILRAVPLPAGQVAAVTESAVGVIQLGIAAQPTPQHRWGRP
jgi:hypothetical protein